MQITRSKLGYGGTQQEMYRLLTDAKKLDETFDAEFSLSAKGTLEAEFADIIEAIHIVQENMGITGATADEAGSTISGSLAMTKAAWENLLVGIADPEQDLGVLTENLVNSAVTAAENIIPRIGEIMDGVGNAVTELAPKIGAAFEDHVVPMVSEGLSKALSLVGFEVDPEQITEAFGQLKTKAGEIFEGIKETVSENSGEVNRLVGELGTTFSESSRLIGQIDWSSVFGGFVEGTANIVTWTNEALTATNDFIDAFQESYNSVWDDARWDEWTNPDNFNWDELNWGFSTAGADAALAFTEAFYNAFAWEPSASLGDFWEKIKSFFTGNPIPAPEVDYSQTIADAEQAQNQIGYLFAEPTDGPDVDYSKAISGAESARQQVVSLLGGTITIPVLYEVTGDATPTQAVASAKVQAAQKADATAAAAQYTANKAAASGDETAARSAQAVADARAEAASKAAAEAAAAVMQANKEAISSKNTKKNAKGAILNRATIFGKVGETYQIGGEAGAEAVAPIETLQNYVSTAVAEVMAGQNAATAEAFAMSANAIVTRLETLADEIAEAMGRTHISINGREFGRLVREV